MTLQLRFALLLLTLFAVLLGGMWLHDRIDRNDSDLLRAHLEQERTTLIDNLLALTGEPLRVMVDDYSPWDEMLNYAHHPDPAWAKLNIDTGLESHHVDAVWVFGPDLDELHGTVRNAQTDLRAFPLNPDELRELTASGRPPHFFALTSAGLIELRGAPIGPSDRQPTAKGEHGWLFAAQRWDTARLRQLESLLGGRLEITAGTPPRPAYDEVITTKPLLDWRARPVRDLRSTFSPSALVRANADAHFDLLFLGSFGVTALLAFAVAAQWWMVRPLHLLGTSLETRSAVPLASLRHTSREFRALRRLVEESFQQEEMLRQTYTAFNAIDDALFITHSPDGHIIHVNSGTTRLLGFEPGELWGRTFGDLKVAQPEAPDEGIWLRCKDGRLVEVEIREHQMPGNGSQRLGVTVARDVSDRRQLEQQRLRAQRMESLGTLAGGVAHDMNNMLTPIILMLDELQDSGQPPSPNLLASVRTSVRRGAGMLRQLLTFGSGIEGERASVDITRLIEDLGRIVSSTFPKSVAFETKIAHKLPAVLGDVTQLHQVLLNLCVNARDAMPDGGFIRVTAVHVVLNEAHATTWPDAKPGPYVRVEVSDNGSGIPPEIVDRIFDPFFTTKASDKGTGLGLSTTLGIIRGHGGSIRVKSKLGTGTCFGLLLPVSTAKAVVETAPPMERIKGGNRTVLVIEDEVIIRDVLKRSLERMGFQILAATGGEEGLAIYDAQAAAIDLVITDLNMPGMDGLTVLRHFRAKSPALPLMVMSGRVDDSILAALKELKVSGLIDKPFGYTQMQAAIQRVLG